MQSWFIWPKFFVCFVLFILLSITQSVCSIPCCSVRWWAITKGLITTKSTLLRSTKLGEAMQCQRVLTSRLPVVWGPLHAVGRSWYLTLLHKSYPSTRWLHPHRQPPPCCCCCCCCCPCSFWHEPAPDLHCAELSCAAIRENHFEAF